MNLIKFLYQSIVNEFTSMLTFIAKIRMAFTSGVNMAWPAKPAKVARRTNNKRIGKKKRPEVVKVSFLKKH